MQQWKDEIEKKSDADLTVCIHHGAGKKSGALDLERTGAFEIQLVADPYKFSASIATLRHRHQLIQHGRQRMG